MQVKIAKIVLSITNNGTPKALVWTEGSDTQSLSEAIELIGDECIYIATRDIGETIELVTKGKWTNIVVPKEYQEALSKPSYNRVKLLFKRAMHGIDLALNGSRSNIDVDTAKVLVANDLDIYLKMQSVVQDLVENTNTKYCKEITKNIGTKVSEQTLSPYTEISKLTTQSLNNIYKDYKIDNAPKDKE